MFEIKKEYRHRANLNLLFGTFWFGMGVIAGALLTIFFIWMDAIGGNEAF